MSEKMGWFHTPIEKAMIEDLYRREPSFKRALSRDWTKTVWDELNFRFNGKIPRNFVLNIRGLVGTPTGIFKSAMGLCIAKAIDPTFNIQERVAFTSNELNIKVKQHAKRKQVFFKDEEVHDLKESQMIKLQNIVEGCREEQMCFIMCGVPKEYRTFSTFILERLDETHDDYLPRKKVRYLIRDPESDTFLGHFIMEIPPLVEKDGSQSAWGAFWAEYMLLKKAYQDRVRFESVTDFNYEHYAKELLEGGYEQFVSVTKKGMQRVDMGLLGMEVRRKYADFTQQEKQDIAKMASTIIRKEMKI